MAYKFQRILVLVSAFGFLQAAVAEAAPPSANPPAGHRKDRRILVLGRPHIAAAPLHLASLEATSRNSERSRTGQHVSNRPASNRRRGQRPQANGGTSRTQGPTTSRASVTNMLTTLRILS